MTADPFLDHSPSWQSQSSSQQQQPAPQTSMGSRQAPSGLPLNLSRLSVASSPPLSPIAPHQAKPGQFRPRSLFILTASILLHALPFAFKCASHPRQVTSSCIPRLAPQPQFSFNFDDISSSGGLSLIPELRDGPAPVHTVPFLHNSLQRKACTENFHTLHSPPHQPYHTHSRSHSSGAPAPGPIASASIPCLAPQPQFSFNFDDSSSSDSLSPKT
ncbi:hypothetical protein OG21DRAFT_1484277 [Imleria badia]|nr:hypothetical protein OG21DRAFT_1484277 [Imleria badia]